jgi:hypothetical protein
MERIATGKNWDMKLVCLNDMVLIKDGGGNILKKHQSLKIGKIYEVDKIHEIIHFGPWKKECGGDNYFRDNYVRVWFNESDVPLTLVLPKYSFITLEEWRDRQLKEIGL